MQEIMIKRAAELLESGKVNRVLGWRRGIFDYDNTPSVFTDAADLGANFVYNDFCGANLSKYLIKECSKEGSVAVFLKPCDTYSFNQLIAEHKIDRERVYVIGVQCNGMKDVNDREKLAERCENCKSRKHVAYDELIGETGDILDSARFDMVAKLENMTSDERFEFWRGELSRCVRCNACRNVCPACTCEKCIFDNPDSGSANKAPADPFEENMFHIIRAFHVAGRCTDCGECSRVCPENIPLHLLNRKLIKDINELYGDYQAGETVNERGPLVNYTLDDAEPSVVHKRGNS